MCVAARFEWTEAAELSRQQLRWTEMLCTNVCVTIVYMALHIVVLGQYVICIMYAYDIIIMYPYASSHASSCDTLSWYRYRGICKWLLFIYFIFLLKMGLWIDMLCVKEGLSKSYKHVVELSFHYFYNTRIQSRCMRLSWTVYRKLNLIVLVPCDSHP